MRFFCFFLFLAWISFSSKFSGKCAWGCGDDKLLKMESVQAQNDRFSAVHQEVDRRRKSASGIMLEAPVAQGTPVVVHASTAFQRSEVDFEQEEGSYLFLLDDESPQKPFVEASRKKH